MTLGYEKIRKFGIKIFSLIQFPPQKNYRVDSKSSASEFIRLKIPEGIFLNVRTLST
jgi:hypothetical protein